MSSKLEELRKRKNKVVGAAMDVSEEEMQRRLDEAEAKRQAYEKMAEQRTIAQTQSQNPYAQMAAQNKVDQMTKEQKWETVNRYLEETPGARDAWEMENNWMLSEPVKNQYAQEKLADMTPAQKKTYEGMRDLADDYGALFGMSQRVKNLTQGALKQAAGNIGTFIEGMAGGDEENKQALMKMQRMQADGTTFIRDEQGNLVVNPEYQQALDEYESTKNRQAVIDEEFSPALGLARKGAQQVQTGRAGLDGTAKVGYDVAASMIANAPGMAIAAIPGVGPGASLAVLGVQAAGGRVDELSARGIGNKDAMARGVTSGAIESATEILPVGSWVEILNSKEGKSLVRSILQQAGSEATEEGASYIANYVADLAAKDPEAKFSWEELAESMGMGALSGGAYGAIGAGVNRMVNGRKEIQQAATQQAEIQQAEPQQVAAQKVAAQKVEAQQEATQKAAVQQMNVQQTAIEDGARNGNLQAAAELASAKAERVQQDTAQTLDVQTVESAGRDVVEGFARRMNLPEAASRGITESYNGSNPGVFVQAWMNAYDAGRTGSLTEKQAMAGAGSAAAIVNAPEAMRKAYQIGREEAGTVSVEPVGMAERGGTVKVQGNSSIPVEVLQGVASRYGIDIDVVQQLAARDGTEANGMWEAGIARLTLGENSGNAYQTMHHELTHYIADVNPEGWEKFKNSVLSYSSQGGRMGALQNRVVSRYESAYGRGAVAADEAARDILAGVMSTEENVKAFCEHVAADTASTVAEKRTILQTLRDVLDMVIETLRELVRRGDATSGSRYGRELAEKESCRGLVEQYLQLLDETEMARRESGSGRSEQQNTPAASTGVQERYSIQQDETGNPFVEIDEDILKGVESQDILKTIRDEIRRRYPNGFMRNGWKIELTGKGIKEFTSSSDTRTMRFNTPSVFRDKMRMAANLDEIINAADNWTKEEPKHQRKDDIVGFNRANVRVRVGQTDYTAEIVTGVKPNTKEIFYNIVNLQPTKIKTSIVKRASTKRATDTTDSDGSLSINNITQERDNVNENRTEESGAKKYSRPVLDEAQIRQELQKAQAEEKKIREERGSWEDSRGVQELKAKRAKMREQMGLFGIKNWDEATPEWKAYIDKRKAYNEQIRVSRERVDRLAEELKGIANQGKAQREKQAREEYDAEMQRSGLKREEFRRKKAQTEYGTTTNFAEAGYILPDGKMLDFKGEGGAPGQRGMDHREIENVFAPGELAVDNRTAYMNRFIADGNVRVMAENPGVDVSAEAAPSAAQLEQIRKMADSLGAAQHKFGLDISDENGKQVESRWYEGRVNGDRVIQDLRAFYRDGKLPKQDELNAFRYSRENAATEERDLEKENRRLARQNMRLSEQVETLKEEFKLSGGHRMDKTAVSRLARRMVQEYESRYDVKQLEGDLHRYFEYIANSPDASYEEALDTAQTIMRGVLEQSQRANTSLKDAYQPVKEDLKSMTFLVKKGSPAYYELMNAFGDTDGGSKWGQVRRNTRRLNIKLTDGPANWDTQFAELAERYPNLFDDSAGIESNVNAALGVFEADTVYENPYGMDIDTAAQNAAQELFEEYMVTPERYTYADKQAVRVQQLRSEYRQRRQEALQKQKEGFERRLKVERGKADDRLAKQKAMFDERMARRNEGMKWRQERDAIEKIQKRLYRMLSQPTDTNHVPEGLRRPVLDLLNSVNWNTRKAGSQAAYQFELAMKNIGDMAAMEIGADGSGAEIDFDPDLKRMIEEFLATAPRDSQGRVDLDPKQTSATQMRRLREIMQTVSHSIANANRMMADEKGRQIEEVAVESVHEMEDRTSDRLRERHPNMKKLLDNDAAETIEGVYGLEMMDAGSYFRSLGYTAADSIYKPIRKGFDKRVELLREAQDYMKKALTGIDVKKWSGAGAPKQMFKLMSGEEVELTPGQIIELYCLTQRPQAREHLTVGGIRVEKRPGVLSKRVSLTPTDIANIVASLSNEQVRMAKDMQTYLSTTAAEWGNEASMKMYGIRKFKEKAYWPIKTSDDYVRTNDANSGNGAGLWGVKNKGMTKAVQAKANNPLVIHDAFDTWYQHVDDMATYSSLVAPLSDAMKWYNWRSGTEASVKEALENLYGDKGKRYFLTLMKDVNGMSDRASPTKLNKLLGMLNRNWKVAKVGGNLRVFVQQPTSYLRAATEVDPKYLVEAVAKVPGNIRRAMKEAPKYCPIAQWADWGFFETNLGQSMRDVLIGDNTMAEQLREVTTAPAGAADHMTRGVLWLACEEEVRENNPELKGEEFKQAVGDRLSEVIDRTQVVDSVLHRSALMRSKNEAVQMMMNFMAEPTKSYNLMRESAAQLLSAAGKEKKIAAGKRFGRVAGTYLVTALATSAAAALVDSIRVKDDERDKKLGERYQTALLENFLDNVNILQSMPIIKDVLSMLDGFDVERSDMTALADFIDGVKWITTTITKDGKVTFNQIMNHVAGPISSMTGLPAGNVWRDSKGLYDLATGLMDPLNIDRNLRAEQNVVTYDDLVTQVRRESGWPNTGKYLDKLKALYGSGNGTYADMIGGEKAKAVDSWLEKLSQNAGKNGKPYTVVLPKMVTNKISYTGADGEQVDVYLGGADYLAYAEQVQKTACDLVYSYMNGVGKTASTEQQAKFAVDARNYAVQTARQNFIDGYEVTDWVADVQAQDMDPAEAIAAYAAVKTAESDKDADGNAVSGSKAKNAVAAMVDQGFKEGEARALYESLNGNEDSQYLELFRQVKDNPKQVDDLAALFGAGGQPASYAGMLNDKSAEKVDSYLKQLSYSAGKSVMPDYMEAMFSYTKDGKTVDVDMSASEYIDYAQNRTDTAYDLLEMFLPKASHYGKDIQGEVVNAVEEYATQTARAKVSDYETSSWVKKVQQASGVSDGNVNEVTLEAIMAREIINSATGVKGEDGKTISGSKKRDAKERLANAGYNETLVEIYYQMFK